MYIINFVKYFIKIGILYQVLLLNCKNCSYSFRLCNYRQEFIKSPINFHKSFNSDYSYLDSSNLNTEIPVIDKTPIKDHIHINPKSNNYPNFCLGDYYLFDTEINRVLSRIPKRISHYLFCYLYLLSKSKITLCKYGGLKISKRTNMNNNQIKKSKIKNFEYYFGDYGMDNDYLDISHYMLNCMSNDDYEKNSDEFIKNLDNQTIDTYDVADLISDYSYNKINRNDLKKSLKEYLLNSNDKPSFDSIKPIIWVYNHSSNHIKFFFYLRDIDLNILLHFRVLPFHNYMIRGPVYFKSLKQFSSYETNVNETMDINNKNDEQTQMEDNFHPSKKKFIKSVIATSKVSKDCWNPFVIICKDKVTKCRHLLINTCYRTQINCIIKVLQTLDHNLPSKKTDDNLTTIPSITCNMGSHFELMLKLITVYVNSKFSFYIPLLTYLDLKDGKTYLCNNNIPIETNPELAFPLNSSPYLDFTQLIIPDMYKNSALFSSKDIKFKDEDILKLLSSYRDLKKFIYNNKTNVNETMDINNKNNQQTLTLTEEQEQHNHEKDNKYDYYYEILSNYCSDLDELEPDLKFEKIEYKEKDKEEGKLEKDIDRLENMELYKMEDGLDSEDKQEYKQYKEENYNNTDDKNKDNKQNKYNINVYLVNGKHKMIYKNDGNAISVNLLLK